MSVRMFSRRSSEIVIGTNSDEVMFGVSLPGQTALHGASGIVGINNVATSLLNVGHRYAMEGWLLPIEDPDGAISFDSLWDQFVPKDTDADDMDLDTDALDTTPFYEPGEIDWQALTKIGFQPTRVFARSKMMTFGLAPTGFNITSSDVLQWVAQDRFPLRLKKKGGYFIERPMALVFAIASPNLDDTIATVEAALLESEWSQVRFIKATMQRALMQLLGVIEATAETPWVEAAALLQKVLEPNVFEQTANFWTVASWRATGELMVDYSVEGELTMGQMTSGR